MFLFIGCAQNMTGEAKRREGTIVVYQQVTRLRDIFPRFIAAVEHVARFEKGGLTKDCACEQLQLQAACKHKIVVVVDGNVAAVAFENASVVGQRSVALVRRSKGAFERIAD